MIAVMSEVATLVGQVADGPLADPPLRATLMMALLGFVVLGIGLVVGVLLGGRWARRGGRSDLRKPLSLRGRRPAIGIRYDDPKLTGRSDDTAGEPSSADQTSVDRATDETQAS